MIAIFDMVLAFSDLERVVYWLNTGFGDRRIIILKK